MKLPFINIMHVDCMIHMSSLPDSYYDLAIIDPNYGIGASRPSKKGKRVKQKDGSYVNIKQSDYKHKCWDDNTVSNECLSEVIRVSKRQIIWGVNYFDFPLPGGRIIWNKLNGESDQSDCEIAYYSEGNRVDLFYYMWRGMMQGKKPSRIYAEANIQIGNKKNNEKRIHPTQKPVILYKYLLQNYANKGDKIFDSHLGSGSISIACHDLGFDLDACEIDSDYYEQAKKRYNLHRSQIIIY